MNEVPYDALIVVSFGGPEGIDDVLPFLENVLRGKNVPHERMMEVYEHYKQFNGISPINEQNLALISALREEFKSHEIDLPIYFGNRNWHPMLGDTLRQMKDDGIKNALAFFTSMYSCYSGCRQYRENILNAQATLGAEAPNVAKVRMAFNHPLYIEASSDRVEEALRSFSNSNGDPASRFVVFTAHSIPMGMAENCNYEIQLKETCRLIMERFPHIQWKLVYQSRSGPPTQPWLEPDVCDFLEQLASENKPEGVVIMPVGFISDHIEVMFDLDEQAREKCEQLGLTLVRSKTVGTHPRFVSMIRELVQERISNSEKRAIGLMPANWDVCPVDCCTYTPVRGIRN